MSVLDNYVEYPVGGKTFKLHKITLGILKEFTNTILSRKVAGVKQLLTSFGPLSTEDKLEILNKYSTVDPNDAMNELQTMDGIVLILYLCAKRYEDASFSENDIADLISITDLNELQEVISKLLMQTDSIEVVTQSKKEEGVETLP